MRNDVKKRLLVVEDDELLCKFLGKSLRADGYETDLLLSGEEIPRKMERNSFNLVVLDLNLPGKDGFYWIKWFKNYYPGVPIIIISSKVSPEDRVSGLAAGAHDYVLKPFQCEELSLKVKFLLNQFPHVSRQQPPLIEMGDFLLDTANNAVIRHGCNIQLTQLECKILQLLHMNIGLTVSREDLMWQTMGMHYLPSNRSIDTHINRIRKKIEDVPSRPAFILTMRGKGYCFALPANT